MALAKAAIRVRGLTELNRALRHAPTELRRELPRVVRAAVKPAHTLARATAPVARGQLRRNTKLTVRRQGAAITVPAGPYGAVRMFGRAANVRGHTRAGASVGPYSRRLSPSPYPLKAIDRTYPQIERDIVGGVEQILRDAFARLG